MLPELTLILGGAASGKSAFAEGLVTAANRDKLYVATAQVFDGEMRDKVNKHKEMRGSGWTTIEAPFDLEPAILRATADHILLLDCATMWLSNHLLAENDLKEAENDLFDALSNCAAPIVVVSNEVGLSVVPENNARPAISRRAGAVESKNSGAGRIGGQRHRGTAAGFERPPSVTCIYWVRHGPTHAKYMVGWSDIPADLSDSAQLKRLEAALPRNALVVSSDLIRATATADAVAGGRQRLPHDSDLREMHFGEWELQAYDAVSDQDHLRAFLDYPGDVRPPDGESWRQLTARVDRAVERLCLAYPDRDIVAVAHFGVILTQVQQALRVSAYEALGHRIDNLSMTELHMTSDGWRAEKINHLP